MLSCKRKKANFYLSPKKAFIRKKEKNSFQKFSKIQNNDNLFFYFFLLLGFTNLVFKSFWKPIYRTTYLVYQTEPKPQNGLLLTLNIIDTQYECTVLYILQLKETGWISTCPLPPLCILELPWNKDKPARQLYSALGLQANPSQTQPIIRWGGGGCSTPQGPPDCLL